MEDVFLQRARQVVEEQISDTEFNVEGLSKSIAITPETARSYRPVGAGVYPRCPAKTRRPAS